MTAERRALPWTALGLAAGSALILASAPAQYFGRQHDDLVYVILSQALAHGSYRLWTSVGRPFLPMFTPGWPALLLPISWLCPGRLGVYEAFAALLQAMVPWACFAWLRRRGLSPVQSLLIALLCASSPVLLSQAGTVMSETAFLLLSLGLLMLLERPRPGGAAVGGCLAGLVLLRPAGLALVPAALAPLLRRRRALAWAAAIPAALGGAWVLGWKLKLAGPAAAKRMYQGRSWVKPLSVPGFEKLAFYARALAAGLLPRAWASGAAGLTLGCVLLGCAAWGCAQALRRRRDDPAALAFLGTAALLAVWAFSYERYCIPLLPLAWWACAKAWRGAATPVLAGLLLLQLVFGAPPWLRGTSWRTPELTKTYAWLSQNMPPDAALASATYVRDGFYAGRPSAPLPDTETDAEFAAQLAAQRVRYVLWQDGLEIGDEAPLEEKLRRAQAHLGDAKLFREVHDDASERARVYLLE